MSRYETARRSASEGAAVASSMFRTELDVETKSSKMDFVTRADTETQRRAIEVIRDEYPDATVVGEEEDERKTVPPDGDAWVIDPIDGTSNFVHGIQLWTTTVAAVRSGETVAAATVAPALGDTYLGSPDDVTLNGETISVSETTDTERFTVAPILRYGADRDQIFGSLLDELTRRFGDVRRFGCAQVTLGMLACGSLDAVVSTQPRPNPWDTIAGVYLVERAGGRVTDLSGEPWDPNCEGLIASNGQSHKKVVKHVTSVAK